MYDKIGEIRKCSYYSTCSFLVNSSSFQFLFYLVSIGKQTDFEAIMSFEPSFIGKISQSPATDLEKRIIKQMKVSKTITRR